MSRWKTGQVVSAISVVPGVLVGALSAGEDYTTQQITLIVDGSENNLFVRGFVTDHKPLNGDDDVDVEMVEVTTGYSDGDMPNDPILVVAHGQVSAALMQLGHKVVRSMDPYF